MKNSINKLNISIESIPEHMYLIPFEKIPTYSQTVVTQIYLFFSLFYSNEDIPVLATHDSVIFGEAVNYMNSIIYESPSIEKFAKKVRISQAGLKNFKSIHGLGLGVHKYFLKLKLNLAAKMLENGDLVTDTEGISPILCKLQNDNII